MDHINSCEARKAGARVLRFLSRGPARVMAGSAGDKLLLDADGRGTIAVERSLVAALAKASLVVASDGRLALAETERVLPDNHRDIAAIVIPGKQGMETVAVNRSESPLGQLIRRKGKGGAPFLSQAEFRAGERLRADYTRGQIMPRLGANWEASVSSGRRDGGIAELTDAALAARLRVEAALRAVGPELSGVLIAVCCFLKGMEPVEMERGWPVRSAKVVLKTALGALSRHYNPDAGPPRRRMLHWGAADYRPSIT